MTDRFADRIPGLDSPASDGFAVTPSDDDDLPETTRALYVGSGGDIALTLASGADLTFVGVAPGTLLPIRVTRVLETGTEATGMVGLI